MSSCRLTCNFWIGDLPAPGQFLKAERGRTAYEITEIRPLPNGRMGAKRFVFICERWPAREMPEGALVHDWKWAPRERGART